VVPGVRHVDIARGVDGDADRLGELAVAGALGSPLAQEVARRAEALDAVVLRVGDVDLTGRGGGDAARVVELAVSRSIASPLEDRAARGGEARRGGGRHLGRAPALVPRVVDCVYAVVVGRAVRQAGVDAAASSPA